VLVLLVLIGVSVVLGLRKRERERNAARLANLHAKYAAATRPRSNPAFVGLTKTSRVVPLDTKTELKVEAVE
jgi:hypothetical protein